MGLFKRGGFVYLDAGRSDPGFLGAIFCDPPPRRRLLRTRPGFNVFSCRGFLLPFLKHFSFSLSPLIRVPSFSSATKQAAFVARSCNFLAPLSASVNLPSFLWAVSVLPLVSRLPRLDFGGGLRELVFFFFFLGE